MKFNFPSSNEIKIKIEMNNKNESQNVEDDVIGYPINDRVGYIWVLICNPYQNLLQNFGDYYNIINRMVDLHSIGNFTKYFDSNADTVSTVDIPKAVSILDMMKKNNILPTNRMYDMTFSLNSSEKFQILKKLRLVVTEGSIIRDRFIKYPYTSNDLRGRKVHGIITDLDDSFRFNPKDLYDGSFLILRFVQKSLAELDYLMKRLNGVSEYFQTKYIYRSKITNPYVNEGYMIFMNYHHRLGESANEKINISKTLGSYYQMVRRIRKMFDYKLDLFRKYNEREIFLISKHINKKNSSLSIRLANAYNIPIQSKFIHSSNKLITNIYNINKYFLIDDKTNINKLLLSKEAIYSMSKPDTAQKITDIISQSIKNNFNGMKVEDLTITEATANVGGNVINFSKHFKQVIAIEKDSINFKALKSNIEAFHITNVELINNNYVECYHDISTQVLFIDPPWGGLYYNHREKQMLKLDHMNMNEIFDYSKAKVVVYKVPHNFDFNEVISRLGCLTEQVKIEIHPINSFILMIMTRLT